MKYKVMLAQIGNESDLDSKQYIFEPKLDGIRALWYINKTGQLFTRNETDITIQFPELISSQEAFHTKSCVLDGEIVVYDEHGNPNFQLLQGRDQLASSLAIRMRAQQHPATFVIFDILEKNGKSLTEKPLTERKKILEETVTPTDRIQLMPYTSDGHILWNEIQKRNIEGVMAKSKDSSYTAGKRSTDWLKIKSFTTIDCIILGYTQEKRIISSLALGLYEKKKLIYIGKVGTGFDEKMIKKLHSLLKKITTPKAPVKKADPEITWVEPSLVCEIQYLEFTADKKLRNPSFIRLRSDKKPQECILITT